MQKSTDELGEKMKNGDYKDLVAAYDEGAVLMPNHGKICRGSHGRPIITENLRSAGVSRASDDP